MWLAPVQVAVLPLSEKTIDYARKVTQQMKDAGFRVHLDDRNEKLQGKIRDAQLQKIPYMLVLGGREAEAGTVGVRHRTKGDLGPRPIEQFVADLRAPKSIRERSSMQQHAQEDDASRCEFPPRCFSASQRLDFRLGRKMQRMAGRKRISSPPSTNISRSATPKGISSRPARIATA